MSILAITAAHFAGLPARFAVGKWSRVSTPTLLAFNTVDIGLNLLIKSVQDYFIKSKKVKLTYNQNAVINILIRVVTCLTAVYLTSKFTDPMPLEFGVLCSVASAIAILVAVEIANWAKKP